MLERVQAFLPAAVFPRVEVPLRLVAAQLQVVALLRVPVQAWWALLALVFRRRY